MELRLKHELTPSNAPVFADDIVTAAASVSGVRLDYTPDSLTLVDNILDEFRSEGLTSEKVAETVFGFGCYVGEVLVRHGGGRWRETTEQEQEQGLVGWPMLIEFTERHWSNPIGKAFKRLANGPEDSLRYFYEAVASEDDD